MAECPPGPVRLPLRSSCCVALRSLGALAPSSPSCCMAALFLGTGSAVSSVRFTYLIPQHVLCCRHAGLLTADPSWPAASGVPRWAEAGWAASPLSLRCRLLSASSCLCSRFCCFCRVDSSCTLLRSLLHAGLAASQEDFLWSGRLGRPPEHSAHLMPSAEGWCGGKHLPPGWSCLQCPPLGVGEGEAGSAHSLGSPSCCP